MDEIWVNGGYLVGIKGVAACCYMPFDFVCLASRATGSASSFALIKPRGLPQIAVAPITFIKSEKRRIKIK